MLEIFEEVAAATDMGIDPSHRLAIGVVGAGAIVDLAHLPSYRQAGLDVVAIQDTDLSKATEVAERHGISKVCTTLDDLLSIDEVQVVDIGVVPWAQPEIAHAALDAGKHVLCQKPLALEIDVARGLVDHAERVDRCLGVNQQLRFDEGIAVAKAMMERGWIGEVQAVRFDVDVLSEWSAWPWLVSAPRLDLQYHSLHYMDAIRFLVGEPNRVFATAGRFPGQVPKGETRSQSILMFDGGSTALVTTNHENITGDTRAEFRIDGSEGSIRGTLGMLYNYPVGRPDTLEVLSRSVPTDGWLPYPVTSRWLPDAFIGPMGALLKWIATGDRPATSGEDNLGTLRLIDALYTSIESGSVIELGDQDPAP